MFDLIDVHISKLKPNKGQIEGVPQNPRFIRDKRYEALKKSISESPEMLSLREIIAFNHKGEYVIICGNMRFRALKELGYKETTIKLLNEDTPVDKLREYAIKDNESFGENDWDIIANEWDEQELRDWGMEIKDWEDGGNGNVDFGMEDAEETAEEIEEINEEDEAEDTLDGVHDILFESDNDFDIPTLKLSEQASKLELPITPWGKNSRLRKDVITYHFYCDDYKFEALWKDPYNLLVSGCHAIIEPNFSLHNETPIALGLQNIYKKRWIARYCQDCGIKVYADLNVAPKFSKYNMLGIPKGYNAFFTRAITGQLVLVENDYKIAQEISGLEKPNFIVYGGGKEAKDWCKKNNILYVEDYQQKELKEMLNHKETK